MKLLVDKTLVSYATPAIYAGFQAARHDKSIMSTFDTFDKVNPDVYIADADLLDESVLKNIEERPHLKVCIVQKDKFDQPHPNFSLLTSRLGDIYPWVNESGHAEILEYINFSNVAKYKADVVSIEDVPIQGIENIQLPQDVIFRIFSSNYVQSPYFCGFLPNPEKKHVYASSKVSLSSGNNYYNSAFCNCYPLNNNDNILDAIDSDNSAKLKEIKDSILESNNNFYSVSYILELLNMTSEANKIKLKLKELL